MKIVINGAYRQCENFIRMVPEKFDGGGTLLHSGRNTVKSFTVDGTELIVKRYKRPNIIQRIAYTFFKKSKAERAYLYAAELRKRGLKTPHEAAFIEIKDGGLLSDSYFISAACHLPALTTPLQRPGFDTALADKLAAYLAKMHEHGVLHGDTNLGNILYETGADGSVTFWLIDTNRSKFHHPSYNECIENLRRLTHYKPLLDYVIRQYATCRGFNPDKASADIIRKIEKFEHDKDVRHKIKKRFTKR